MHVPTRGEGLMISSLATDSMRHQPSTAVTEKQSVLFIRLMYSDFKIMVGWISFFPTCISGTDPGHVEDDQRLSL